MYTCLCNDEYRVHVMFGGIGKFVHVHMGYSVLEKNGVIGAFIAQLFNLM